MYAKCGELLKAKEVFDQLTTPDVVSWSALIAGYVQHGQSEEALICFDEMRRRSLSPDAIAYIWVLKACGNMRASGKGEELHDQIVREGLLARDSFIGTALIDMYASCGQLAKAQQVFNELRMRDVVAWSALIAGYAGDGDGEEALRCYNQMQSDGIPANEVTFLCILEACCDLGALDKGQEMHAEVERQGLLGRSILIGNALLEVYAKCGLRMRAQEVFDQLLFRDVVTWNVLLALYAQLGEDDRVVKLFNAMAQHDDIQPNPVTFTVLLTACSHSGQLYGGELCFQAMSRYYSIIPNMEHYTCMVDLFGRGGCIEKAVEIIKKMPSLDYLPVWMTFLSACCRLGDENLGRLAFQHAVQLNENHASLYVCMRNIYASTPNQVE
jgi:pentatricopeptide repeat protein